MKEIKVESKIREKFIVTIPPEVREVLNLREGDYLLWKIKDRTVEVKRGVIIESDADEG